MPNVIFENPNLVKLNSIHMDWTAQVDPESSPEGIKLIDNITSTLVRNCTNKSGSKAKREIIYRAILTNLARTVAHTTQGKGAALTYATTPEALSKVGFGRETVRDCIKEMAAHALIEVHSGGKDMRTLKKFSSRMKCTANLMKRFNRLRTPIYVLNEKHVIVRDQDKNDITEDIDIPVGLVNTINKINKNNRAADIRNSKGKRLPIGNGYKVFNNGCLSEGGRFYEPIYQSLSTVERQLLTINGEAVVEEDFKNLHPQILYDINGANLDFDAYHLQGDSFNYIDSRRLRKLVKVAFNILLNASTKRAAEGAIRKEAKNILSAKEAKRLVVSDLVEHVKTTHKPIDHCFHKGFGITLQCIDSMIAESVLEFFADHTEPCLCVHDSFIVRESKRADLRKAMDIAYNHEMENYLSSHSAN